MANPTIQIMLDAHTIFRKSCIQYKQAEALAPVGYAHGPAPRVRAYNQTYTDANPAQFDGTVTPARVVEVQLRKRGDTYCLEKIASNETTGYFAFEGVYYELDEYEFVFTDHVTNIKTVVPVSTPEYLRWNGNRHVYPMTGFTRT